MLDGSEVLDLDGAQLHGRTPQSDPVPQRAWYEGDSKLVVQEDGFAELYDLDADPYEMRNLAGDPEHRGTLERLCTGLRDAMSETGDVDGGRLVSAVTDGRPALP